MIQQQNKGAQIRSRAKWIEEEEKSPKYFLTWKKAIVLLIQYLA